MEQEMCFPESSRLPVLPASYAGLYQRARRDPPTYDDCPRRDYIHYTPNSYNITIIPILLSKFEIFVGSLCGPFQKFRSGFGW